MKLTDKQKLSIWKSLKLNEDFFDDFNDNDIINNPVDELIDDPDYTYNFQFIIFMYPFIKDVYRNGECVYYFEDPKYKTIIESRFLLMKKVLDYILQASSIVTDYSKPKFCSSYEKNIKIFPFMNNKQSNDFEIMFSDKHFITLKTSINLSGRKHTHNIIKLLCSFWKLQQIYCKLLYTNKFNKHIISAPLINIGIYRNNPYKKTNLYPLMQTDREFASEGLELINFLNDKDETD